MTSTPQNLIDRLKARIQREVTEIEARADLTTEEKVSRIIHIFSATCAAAAAQPLPFADIFILTPIQAYMGARLSAIRGMPISDAKANELLKEVLGTVGMGMLAQQAALGLYKVGLPFLAGVTTIPLVYGLTFAIGRTMDYYLKEKARGKVVSAVDLKRMWHDYQKEGRSKGKEFKP
ncbi:DUF697 domain-containing protein [Vulcanococcus limneticus Candia 3B3]|uniref:YcjF family protein n=1 Tax=Vulcanococcus limneticus TaxID=2170428 RepID=UPI000B99D3D5|nr:DUF697 domain-containing protein [Vulcanococcus limneticus]MCP9897157.1 DUF697 domain-containing protein [Vulcanococcus limneticus Candia 3B3]